MAPNDNLVGSDAARDGGAFTDDDIASLDVAFHDAVDLNLALADEVAGDGEIGANDRNGPRSLGARYSQERTRLKCGGRDWFGGGGCYWALSLRSVSFTTASPSSARP